MYYLLNFLTIFMVIFSAIGFFITFYSSSVKTWIIAGVDAVLLLISYILTSVFFQFFKPEFDLDKFFSAQSALFSTACLALLLPVMALTAAFIKKHQGEASMEGILLFAAFPIIQTLLFLSLVAKIAFHITVPAIFACIGSIVICVAADIRIFFALKEISQKSFLRQQALFYQEQLKLQLHHYENFSSYNDSLTKVRRTLDEQIRSIDKSLKTQDYSNAASLVNSAQKNIDNLKTVSYCDNKMINAVIFSKRKDIQDANIQFHYELGLDDDLPIEKSDLCRIFSNILDNAIDASVNSSEDPEIWIQCAVIQSALVIKCKNSCAENPKMKSNILPNSTKREPGHGYGMGILKDIAEKYNGTMDFGLDEDCRFSITIILNLY